MYDKQLYCTDIGCFLKNWNQLGFEQSWSAHPFAGSGGAALPGKKKLYNIFYCIMQVVFVQDLWVRLKWSECHLISTRKLCLARSWSSG